MEQQRLPFYSFNTVIVGSGAAGLNAAVRLFEMGQTDIAIITEGMNMGASRNTGSDKQTYYKLTVGGDTPDSARAMARTLFEGGCVDGDIALAEAAGSVRSFFHLIELGVPFPTNAEGEYVGYKTDHDPMCRATSAGPYTSRFMTEALERRVRALGIPVFDQHMVIRLLTEQEGGRRRAAGVLALDQRVLADPAGRMAVFAATNVVWATGGEAGMYRASVYPASQWGASGLLFQAGAAGKNLTESQYGIASTRFRWNLSGSYQQCVPRYVSTDADGGDEREFLFEGFDSPGAEATAVFLKGYQWPFDPRKTKNGGSSMVDLLVYREEIIRGRRVWLDFTRSPQALLTDGQVCFDRLSDEARCYLSNCGALQETPLERLRAINPAAIAVYADHGIDLARERLEISVCAQHNNGGIAADAWWESDVRHLFPVGEVNGSHGVYRPGGTALNAGQVGSLRAATRIAHRYTQAPPEEEAFLKRHAGAIGGMQSFLRETKEGAAAPLDTAREIALLRERMTRYGAFVRSAEGVRQAIAENRAQAEAVRRAHALRDPGQLPSLFRLMDLLTAQYVYLEAIADYIARGGGSRGSYLVSSAEGRLPRQNFDECFRSREDAIGRDMIQEIRYDPASDTCTAAWRGVRPIPEGDQWFETVWRDYRSGAVYD